MDIYIYVYIYVYNTHEAIIIKERVINLRGIELHRRSWRGKKRRGNDIKAVLMYKILKFTQSMANI